jgi:lipid II:glycine glycyltransferase (peptidoglycan interpeptide bridge formation enzyme)
MTDVTAAGATATDAGPGIASRPAASPRTTELLRQDPDAWDAFVAAAPNGSFPQLTAWAEANAPKGWRARRVIADSASGPVGAQLLIHHLRPGPWSRAYAPRGPVGAVIDAPAIAAFTRAVRAAAAEERLVHVTIDPELEAGGPVEGWLRGEGWEPAGEIQINRTRIIDLHKPEAELWGDLRSSTRWSVNKAGRSGFVVTESGAEGLDDFGALYLETAQRVGFTPFNFRAVYEAFARRGGARILIARAPGGAPAATLMLLDCGDRVIELYGASSREGAQGRANHLVKWEAIRASAARGIARYDMWGTDEEGVATFKASFGGAERQYIAAWRLVTDARAASLVATADRGRRAARNAVRTVTGRSGATTSAGAAAGPVGTSIDRDAPDGWNARTVDLPGGHVMQGTAWADHRRSQGGHARFVTLGEDRGALVILREQRLLPGFIATARKGPIHAGDPIEAVVERAVRLAEAARAEGATELFLDPEIDADPAYGPAMEAAGFHVTDEVQPSIHVMRLVLPADGRDPDALLASYGKSTRQRIRSAEKAGTTVRVDTAGERLARFGELLVERADDLGIPMKPELGYLAFWRRLLDAGHARLYVAEREGAMLGGVLVYLQGGAFATAYSADDASTRRELPGTMHLVRATLLRDALLDGARYVDLGGVDLPGRRGIPQPGDPNRGLYEHKAGFGATWVVREPARRIVLRPWADRAGRLSRRALGTARKLKGGR